MTPRQEFVSKLRKIVARPTSSGDRVRRILDLIADRVDEALEGDCVELAYHWRQSDTGELFTGSGEEVGECETGCPVCVLDVVGLIEVSVWPPCLKGHSWYGGGCPECEAMRGER
jgi:hypothetical protein